MKSLAFVVGFFVAEAILAQGFGDCSRSVRTEWLDDGRKMKLLDDYVYIDDRGKEWVAAKDSSIDGASIPRFLWSFIGGPFEGPYRKASVSHDVECDLKRERWRDVHWMFFEAMRCSEVTSAKAHVMYAAVYHCGPRWGPELGVRIFPCTSESMKAYVRRFKKLFYSEPDYPVARIPDLRPADVDHLDGRSPAQRLADVLPEGSVLETESQTIAIVSYFAPGGTKVDAVAQATLERVGAVLSDMPGLLVTSAGHADEIGTNELNMAIGYQRADSVAAALEAASGLSDIGSISFGEERPFSTDSTVEGRQRNRRVDLIIREGL